MIDREMILEEVAIHIDVSTRNIKYWTRVHALPIRREGRRNIYPARTIEILRAIARLSELGIHTTRFIRWLVDAALDRPIIDPDYRRFARIRPEFETVLDAARLARLSPPVVTPFRRRPVDSLAAARRDDDVIL